MRAWNSKYRQDNLEEIKVKQKIYSQLNREKLRAKSKVYYYKNKERLLKKQKEYYLKNSIKVKKYSLDYQKNQVRTNKNYHLARVLRSRLSHALNGRARVGSCIKDLGCSIEELKIYLESQFKEGMSWDSYGLRGWHIDHKKSLIKFDLTDRKQFLEACHYTNLQPMWWRENISKGGRDLNV